MARTLAGNRPPPGALHGCFYARFAIVLPCVPLIVSAAAQSEILNRVLATHSPWVDVVELEAPTRATPPAIRRNITTLLTIS